MAGQQTLNALPSSFQVYSGAVLTAMKKPPRGATPLPSEALVLPGAVLEPAAVARYAEVCGFRPEQGVPLTYPHMLAFRLQMRLMAGRQFPYPLLGLVHLSNEIRQHDVLEPGMRVSLRVGCGGYIAHPKGQAFALDSTVMVGGKVRWESRSVYLKIGVRAPQGEAQASRLETMPAALKTQSTWQVPANIGRVYGRVSGDLNPIHLSDLSAKLFGFRRAIAHGMWTKARALAELLPATPVREAEALIEFKTPMFLPAQANLAVAREGGDAWFEVVDARRQAPFLKGLLNVR